jgi:hypothetical protein
MKTIEFEFEGKNMLLTIFDVGMCENWIPLNPVAYHYYHHHPHHHHLPYLRGHLGICIMNLRMLLP